MNVHDSERLSGLLEDAGYVRRAPTAQRRRGGVQHLRGAGERRQQAVRQPRPPGAGQGRRTRACRSPSAAAWRRRTAARSCAGRRGSTWCSAPTTSARCRRCWSGPGTTPRRRWRSSSRWRSSRRRCRPSATRAYAGWVSISVGCNNTCTFCIVPVAARQGEGPPPRRHPRRGRGAGRRGRARGDPARPERQLLRRRVRRPARRFAKLLRACGDDRRAWSGSGSPRPHPKDFTDDVIDAMAETPNVCHQLHMPLQSGSDRVLRAMRRSYRARALPGHPRARCGPRCRTPRSPPTSSSASRARPRTTSRRPSTWSAQARFAGAFTFQYSPRPGTPAATMAGQVPQARSCSERYERLVALRRRDRAGRKPGAGRRRGRGAGRRRARAARTAPRAG